MGGGGGGLVDVNGEAFVKIKKTIWGVGSGWRGSGWM